MTGKMIALDHSYLGRKRTASAHSFDSNKTAVYTGTMRENHRRLKIISIIICVALLLSILSTSIACYSRGKTIDKMEALILLTIMGYINPHVRVSTIKTILEIAYPDIKFEEVTASSGGGMRGVGGGHSDGH
jgi:hypothetical protein